MSRLAFHSAVLKVIEGLSGGSGGQRGPGS
jgi:hypothetical protein